jgi:hypothetical protein
MATNLRDGGLLKNVRVYLSGPMDFVASRAAEKDSGWRVRVGAFLRALGATVFDPWAKPNVRGLHEYGREDAHTTEIRNRWSFEPTETAAKTRAECAATFWDTIHIDLRMVDVSDFVIAYCPTNIYSVGTPHEVILATQQHKPVLFVSPPVTFPPLDALRDHLADDATGLALLDDLIDQVPIKTNPRGVPSLWYMPLIGSENFFDGFGVADYRDRFDWPDAPIDDHERQHPPTRPLLPFLEDLSHELPKRWSRSHNAFLPDDDWLLLDMDH